MLNVAEHNPRPATTTTTSSMRLPLSTGLSCHVLEWGGDDPGLDHTVVLLHGFLDIAWGWEDTVRALPDRYHVLCPDMRGHGDSDPVGAGGYYHFMDYLADLEDVIAQRGRARVSVVGHSMGGSIASYYAGTYPDRVHRLALLEGIGPPDENTPVPELMASWIAAWKGARGKRQRTYATVAEAAQQLRRHDPLLGEEQALRLAGHGTRLAEDGRLRFKHDPLHLTRGPYPFRLDVAQDFWRRVTCPVLLVEGSESFFRHAPEETGHRYRTFAQAELKLLEGAGHMMQRHQPQALANLLAEFLG